MGFAIQMIENKQAILSVQKCKDNVKDMQNKSGLFWILRQRNLYYSIKNKQGKFAKLSNNVRLMMMENIEINIFGVSQLIEQRKQDFLIWFRNTFERNYNEMRIL